MKIEVVKRKMNVVSSDATIIPKQTNLVCRKIKEKRKLVMLQTINNGIIQTTKSPIEGSASVSTCLGKHIQHYYQDKLNVLKYCCSDVKSKGQFKFVHCEYPIYGIYYDQDKDMVCFHERIGMKQMKLILQNILIFVNVVCEDGCKITEITLTGV